MIGARTWRVWYPKLNLPFQSIGIEGWCLNRIAPSCGSNMMNGNCPVRYSDWNVQLGVAEMIQISISVLINVSRILLNKCYSCYSPWTYTYKVKEDGNWLPFFVSKNTWTNFSEVMYFATYFDTTPKKNLWGQWSPETRNQLLPQPSTS